MLRARKRYFVKLMLLKNILPVIANLEQLAMRATVLVIWTDCDREGEYIGSEIRKICTSKNGTLRVLRARFSSLTERELHNALVHANRLDERIVDAVSARIEIDLRTGASFTRFLTIFLQNNFTALQKHVVSYGKFLLRSKVHVNFLHSVSSLNSIGK